MNEKNEISAFLFYYLNLFILLFELKCDGYVVYDVTQIFVFLVGVTEVCNRFVNLNFQFFLLVHFFENE